MSNEKPQEKDIDWIILSHCKADMNFQQNQKVQRYRSSRPEVFLVKGVLKICSKFTGEHPY